MVKAGAKKDGLDISEQHAVDCGYKQNGANGCNGAQPGAYSKFYKKVKKVMHEGHYPYTAKVGTCQLTFAFLVRSQLTTFEIPALSRPLDGAVLST